MSTTYKCYPSFNILNPDGSINAYDSGNGTVSFDFTLFDYIDLTQFQGEQFTPVTTPTEIVEAFAELSIEVEIEENSVVVLQTDEVLNVQAYKDNFFYLTLDNVILNPIDYSLFNILDTSFYSTTTPFIFVYSNLQLKTKLQLIFDRTVDIVDNKIYVRKYLNTLYNIPVSANPTIQMLDAGIPITNNYTIIQSIDLSYYGGNAITLVSSDLDVRAAFLVLGISVLISGSTITLLEYTGTTADINVCKFSYIEIVGLSSYCSNNTLDFNELYALDFTGFGGIEKRVGNTAAIIAEFALLGYSVTIIGCSIKVLNMPCLDITDTIPARKISTPLAVDDTVPDCILPNIKYSFNPIANDIDPLGQMLTVTAINGTPVVEGQIVSIATGVTVKSIPNCNLELLATDDAVSTQYSFSYTIKNVDGVYSTALVTYCVSNVITPGVDYLTFDCNSSGEIDVTDNDLGSGPLEVTHINNMPVTVGQSMDIITGSLTARLLPDLVTIQLQSLNMYHSMGAITYTITNGGTSTDGILNYDITDVCDVCLDFNMQFTINNCAGVSWGDLTYNNVVVDNYLVKLKKANGDFYVLPSGLEFKIGKGIYAGGTFPPNSGIPMPSGTYSIYIEFSDIGDAIDCFSNYVTVTPIPCGVPCAQSYNGIGGISAQLSYDLEVSASSTINFLNFNTGNVVPDGVVIYYNGVAIYHTGNSELCPYTTPGPQIQQYLTCIGCQYQSDVPTPNANIIVPYVSGVNYATVVVFGYPCDTATTLWSFQTLVICT